MVTTKPYLIRAIHEWCVDQGFTPYIQARVDLRTRVPRGYARDGVIVLNVSPEATHKLALENEFVSFQARFGGVAHDVVVPVDNVLAVYARENGQGMAFDVQEGSSAEPDDDPPPTSPPLPPSRGGHLKVVK